MPRIITNLTIVIFSLALTLLLAEGLCRLIIPAGQQIEIVNLAPKKSSSQPSEKRQTQETGGIDTLLDWSGSHGLRLNPNMQATIVDHRLSKKTVIIETNSLGLRDQEIGEKTSDEFRVLILGDSIVFGDYVSASETLSAQLQAAFSQTSKKMRIINAGIPGANSADETNLYLEVRDMVQPDLVLQMMYLNDSQDSREYYAKPLALPWAHSRLLVWLAPRIAFIQELLKLKNNTSEEDQKIWKEKFRGERELFSGDFSTSRAAYDYEIYNAFNDFGRAWNPETWKKLGAVTRTLKLLTEEQRTPFALVLLPIHMQISTLEEENFPQQKFLELCTSLDLPCHDPLPMFRAAWQSGTRDLLYDHCHYQPQGYTLLANDIKEWLSERQLVPNQ